MCDLDEAELAEHLAYLEAARVRVARKAQAGELERSTSAVTPAPPVAVEA